MAEGGKQYLRRSEGGRRSWGCGIAFHVSSSTERGHGIGAKAGRGASPGQNSRREAMAWKESRRIGQLQKCH